MSGPALYLFYDGECPLCCRFKEWIDRLDAEGAVCALALDETDLPERFPQLDLQVARREITVCNGLGQLFHGIEALRQLTRILPGLRRLDWIYRLPGATPIARRAYRAVNRRRQRLCRQCGEKWLPSLKYSRRNKDGGRQGRR